MPKQPKSDAQHTTGREENADVIPPWWKGAVIYQIYPRSFYDTSGNGVGDLNGCIEKLDYVASLGVDAIWLSPFFISPMYDFGYDVSDYLNVDPLFGTLEDFDRLVECAHLKGLRVIIDQVYSHTSDQHEWFRESRTNKSNAKSEWYVWADAKPDGSPPNNWQSVFGGCAWEWDPNRRQYYLHNFLASQPDLNLHNVAVQDALLDVAKFWLNRGVDGFRLDAINFAMHDPKLRDNPQVRYTTDTPTRPFNFQHHDRSQSHPDIALFLERLRGVVDTFKDRFTVAEIGGVDNLAEGHAFTQGNNRLSSAYSFNYLYADQVTPELVKGSTNDWPAHDHMGWPSWAFSNHDAPRVTSRWGAEADHQAFAKLMILLLLSLRGNSFLYQGEELGLTQVEVPLESLKDPEAIKNWPATLGRDGARTPMPWRAAHKQAGFTSSATPWLPIGATHFRLAVDRQASDPNSTLSFTRAVIDLRKSSPALRSGDVEFLHTEEPLLAYKRFTKNECVYCAFNLGKEALETSFTIDAHCEVKLATGFGVLPSDLIPNIIPPYAGLVGIRALQ